MFINPHDRLYNNEITHQMDFHPMSPLLMVVILSFAMIQQEWKQIISLK